MVVEISPAELLAQTVNIVAECTPVGVPVIAPVAVLNEESWNRGRDFWINSPCIWCATNVGWRCTAHKTVLGECER